MPLVRITAGPAVTPERHRRLADAVHAALVATMNVPADDRFQILERPGPDGLVFDANYLGIARSDGFAVVQVFLRAGRTPDMKRAFYALAAKGAEEAGIRPEDVMISLSENGPVDWSFGQGIAQYEPK